MSFNFNSAQSQESSGQSYTFKNGVKYSYFKADEKRPLSFRILPAFPDHEGPVQNPMDYVPAVTFISGRPNINDWIFAMKVSRSFQKGAKTIVSRKTLIERNVDGTFVEQEDPLTRVIDYCMHNEQQWGYIVNDVGKWGDPNRIPAKLPKISAQYLMNVVTLDDDKPGAKLAVIGSVMAISDLCRTKQGNEGIALRQKPYEVSEEELARDPSALFQYGDITDPNGAPIFKYGKALSDDGGKKVYRITVGIETDPATGRQRTEKMPVTPEDMSARVDLAHPETYINIPTPEEQVKQIMQVCGGRSKDGYHEWDMLRVCLSDYASLIPDVPSAPGAVNQVRGFTPAPTPQPAQQKQAFAPVAQPQAFKPSVQPQAFKPAAPVAHTNPPQAFKPAPASRPAFVPTAPKAAPPPDHDQLPMGAPVAQPAQKPIQNVAGEAEFDPDKWAQQAQEQGGSDWINDYSDQGA